MASRTAKLKRGGKAPMQMYNAKGSKEESEAMDETPGFKKGGRSGHKKGGHVGGHAGMKRADRHKRAAGGRTPYSTGSKMEGEASSMPGEGHESARPGGSD